MRKAGIIALVLLCSLTVQAQPKGVKHVILIGMDGLGAYAIPEADNPNMKQLMAEGSWTLRARSVLPSSSAVNWASMLMGAGSELHGFTEWGSKTPEVTPREVDQYGLFPSIFTLLRAQKPTAEIGVIYSWEGIGYLFPKKAVNKDQGVPSDTALTEASINYIKEKNHGGINKGHGGKTMAEMEIPWIIRGKGIRKGHEVKESVVTYDTAATIAWIFGLKVPQVWTGRPVKEVFGK